MIQDASGWYTGVTKRDGMRRELEGVQDGEHVYTHSEFLWMYGKTNAILKSNYPPINIENWYLKKKKQMGHK